MENDDSQMWVESGFHGLPTLDVGELVLQAVRPHAITGEHPKKMTFENLFFIVGSISIVSVFFRLSVHFKELF